MERIILFLALGLPVQAVLVLVLYTMNPARARETYETLLAAVRDNVAGHPPAMAVSMVFIETVLFLAVWPLSVALLAAMAAVAPIGLIRRYRGRKVLREVESFIEEFDRSQRK